MTTGKSKDRRRRAASAELSKQPYSCWCPVNCSYGPAQAWIWEFLHSLCVTRAQSLLGSRVTHKNTTVNSAKALALLPSLKFLPVTYLITSYNDSILLRYGRSVCCCNSLDNRSRSKTILFFLKWNYLFKQNAFNPLPLSRNYLKNITLQNRRLKNWAMFRISIVCRCLIWSPSLQALQYILSAQDETAPRKFQIHITEEVILHCLILCNDDKMITGMPHLPFARNLSINRDNTGCFLLCKMQSKSRRPVPPPTSLAPRRAPSTYL